MKISSEQLLALSDKFLIQKMDQKFLTMLPAFCNLTYPERIEYLGTCVEVAHSLGFSTERGIASYALCAWWLNLEFEQHSPTLLAIFCSEIPEDQKIRAMNEWVRVSLKFPNRPEVADRVLSTLFDQKPTTST